MIYHESEVHDENNDEDSYIMIENAKIFDNKKSNMKKLINMKEMMLQAIYSENQLKKIMKIFINAVKKTLEQSADKSDLEKDIQQIIS